jgi:hypothetical protein
MLTANGVNSMLPLLRIDPVSGILRRVGGVRGQYVRYSAFSEHGLVLGTMSVSGALWVQRPDGELRHVKTASGFLTAVPCGKDVIVTVEDGDGVHLVRIDRDDGHVLSTLSAGPQLLSAPGCSPDGRTWYVAQWTSPAGLDRCDDRGCQRLLDMGVSGLEVSPDGTRMVFLRGGRSGITAEVLPTAGGTSRGITTSEGGCDPGWSSDRTVWISKRRAGRPTWIEVDVDTLAETGRTVAGGKDCADGNQDPRSPVQRDARVVREIRTEVRLLPTALVPQ